MPHKSEVDHSLILVSSFCDEDHTVEFTNNMCVVGKKDCVNGVGGRAGGMYFVKLKRASDKSFGTPRG